MFLQKLLLSNFLLLLLFISMYLQHTITDKIKSFIFHLIHLICDTIPRGQNIYGLFIKQYLPILIPRYIWMSLPCHENFQNSWYYCAIIVISNYGR